VVVGGRPHNTTIFFPPEFRLYSWPPPVEIPPVEQKKKRGGAALSLLLFWRAPPKFLGLPQIGGERSPMCPRIEIFSPQKAPRKPRRWVSAAETFLGPYPAKRVKPSVFPGAFPNFLGLMAPWVEKIRLPRAKASSLKLSNSIFTVPGI